MQLIKMFKWERCVIWSETNLRVETVTQIEQTVIPDDATSESVKDESSEEGFVSKGWTRGCGSSPVPEDLAQTMIRHRGCGWTCCGICCCCQGGEGGLFHRLRAKVHGRAVLQVYN